MADSETTQQDFSGGIFRGRRAPANAVYDAVNALADDEATLFRRGKTQYRSSTAGSVSGLAALHPLAGPRVIAPDEHDHLYVLVEGSSTPTTILTGMPEAYELWSRLIGVGGLVAARYGNGILLYAGSRKAAYAGAGTIAAVNGSRTITGTGTGFTGTVDKGSLVAAANAVGIVASVDSNTVLTLRDPWTGSTGAVVVGPVSSAGVGTGDVVAIAAAGTVPRLLICIGSRIYFSPPGQPARLSADDYVDIPDGGNVIGAEGVGGSAILGTTTGVWVLSGLDFDELDDAGNLQFSMARLSKDIILWGDSGVAGWSGGLIVPGVYDIYVMGLDGSATVVSEGVRPLYRGYVEAGYVPGIAAVHRGHYLLPVLDPADAYSLVDTLIVRLDRGVAWTRWDGHAASRAFASQVGVAEPALLGLDATRVTALTDCFDPAEAGTDADATEYDMTVLTRDFELNAGGHRSATVEKAEVLYEMEDGTLTLGWASGEAGTAYTTVTAVRGGTDSDGSAAAVWPVNKSRRTVRLRLVQSGGTMVLRQILLRVRKAGF